MDIFYLQSMQQTVWLLLLHLPFTCNNNKSKF